MYHWVLHFTDGTHLRCTSKRLGVSAWFLYWSNGYDTPDHPPFEKLQFRVFEYWSK